MLEVDMKRQRTPPESNESDTHEGKSRRLEAVAGSTEQLVQALSKASGSVMEAVSAQCTAATSSEDTWRAMAGDLQNRLLRVHASAAASELERIAAQQDAECHAYTLEAMQDRLHTGLQMVAKDAYETVQWTLEGPVKQLGIQLDMEQETRERAMEQVRTVLIQAREAVLDSTRRAMAADLRTAERDVLLARLEAGYRFEQHRCLRQIKEVDALVRMVHALAKCNVTADGTAAALKRTRTHVRMLEAQLDLRGIVAAAAPAEIPPALTEPLSSSSPSSTLSLSEHHHTTSPMPPETLRRVAPQYYALRLLEHRDLTISELVESWCGQEARVGEAEARYTALERSVEVLRHDAMTVHQQYIEERQRREIADRRITEMVRERIRPQSDSAAAQELSQLRWNYSQVVDDAAQLAVSLKVARDEVQSTREEVLRQHARIKQLERDAQTDEVAKTLQELRKHYAEKMEATREDYITADTARRLATEESVHSADSLRVASEALEKAREAQLTVLKDLVRADCDATNTQAPSDALAESLAEEKACLEAHVTALEKLRNRTREVYEERLQREQTSLETFGTELMGVIDGVIRCTEAATPSSCGGGGGTSSSAERISVKMEAAVATAQQAESTAAMKAVLGDALRFIASHMEATDTERARLLDTSLSDGQYMEYVLDRLKHVTAQRDYLHEKVKESNLLIQQNHLTVVERALMHEVPVEDALDAAEAAREVTALKDQLEVLRQVQDRAVAEAMEAREGRLAAESEMREYRRQQEVAETHAGRVAEALKAAEARETALRSTAIALQHRLEALSRISTSSTTPPTAPSEDTTTAAELRNMLNQFSEHLDTISRSVAAVNGGTGATGDDGVGAGTQEAISADFTDAALAGTLARSGVAQVVPVLQDVLARARLLQGALANLGTRSLAGLASVADPETMTTPMQIAQLTERCNEFESTVETLHAEREEMLSHLALAEESNAKVADTNSRLLKLCTVAKSRFQRAEEENALLKQQLAALTPALTPASLTTNESAPSAKASEATVTSPPAQEVTVPGAPFGTEQAAPNQTSEAAPESGTHQP